jgi:N-acetylglucosamine-6-phosphate deacetylase
MSPPDRHAVVASVVFDGISTRRDGAVVIEGSRIAWVGDRAQLPDGIVTHEMADGTWLAPGFIDVQVNGGGDVLFNAEPTEAGLLRIARAHRRFGTTSLMPTLISDTLETMGKASGAVRDIARESGILGIHFEGPFLSPEKPGVHEPSLLRPPKGEDLDFLCSLRTKAALVTLAPECIPGGVIAQLVRSNVRVALGHSMATYEQTRRAISEGMTGFTHLFNAMRPLASREPGPIAAALESAQVWFGMIVDGVHVSPAILRMALRGQAIPMLVTDAMPPVGGISDRFTLNGSCIHVHAACCIRDDGVLAGTALNMAAAVRNSIALLGLPLSSALRCASTEPARFLGLESEVGRLAPGLRADMVAFDPSDIARHGTWRCGQGASPGCA